MARERTRSFLDGAKGRAKSDPAVMAAAIDAIIPALSAEAEQATSDEANLHLSEVADGDDPKLREFHERCTQKLGSIRRDQAEIVRRLRRLARARREYNELLTEMEAHLAQADP